MIARSACPDCLQNHAILVAVAGRAVARCTRCRRFWPPERHAGADTGVERCSEHPGRRTRWVCERCDLAWCRPCGRRVRAPGFNTTLSPCCREGLVPVAELQTVRPFWSELPAVLLYALRGGSPFVLLFLFFGGFVPILAWTIPFFAAAYGVHVIRVSSADPYRAPGFPEPDDILVEFLYPLLRLLGAGLIAGFPWVLYFQYGPDPPNVLVTTLFLVLGVAAFPAIVLNTTIRGRLFRALDPGDLSRTMRWMGPDYLALVAALAVFVLAWKATGRLAGNDALLLMLRLVRFYLLITLFHVFGRSVWQTRHRIDWGV
jgi:hypothetical protein